MIQRDPQSLASSVAAEAPLGRRGRVGTLAGYASVWIVGLEGVGLSAAARLLRSRGVQVGGVDRAPGPRVRSLIRFGVSLGADESAPHLPDHVDLVVRSAAVPESHPQVAEAHRRGVTVWKYAELLGALMQDRLGICIAGCHGKTTTSSLLASTLLHAGADPSFVIGGTLAEFDTGARHGGGTAFVAESCEFDRSFHHHAPRIAVVTNVDEDHLDYYADLAEIEASFRVFARRLPSDGALIVHTSCAAVFRGDARLEGRMTTYGEEPEADVRVEGIQAADDGRGTHFRLVRHDGPAVDAFVPLHGAHNVANATAALLAATRAGVAWDDAVKGLARFAGVGRRMERVARVGTIDVVDDYAHHPAEIAATLEALRARYPERRLVVLFQPHQASRTRCLLGEFAAALAQADEVFLPPIYFARDSEAGRRAVTSDDLVRAIVAAGGRAHGLPDLDALCERVATTAQPHDVLVTMGAGNIDEVARGLARRLP